MQDSQFDTLWADRLLPFLEGLEAERKTAVKHRFYWVGGGLVAGLAGGFVGAYTLAGGDLGFVAVGLFIGLLIGLVVGNHRIGKLKKRIKGEINTCLAEALDLSYAPHPSSPARFETFRSFDLLPSYDRCGFEDHFSGERQGCDFELYEAKLEQRRRTDKGTYYVTVFQGVLIRITFPRKVEGVTVISRDLGWFNALGKLGRSFGGHKLERIGLVDPEFERVFEVYGDDQVLARYMLTPSFMERLLALEAALKGKNVRAVFDQHSGQGELLIAAETGDLFEAGSMSDPLTDQARVQRMVDELTQVLAIIELLVEPATFGAEKSIADLPPEPVSDEG